MAKSRKFLTVSALGVAAFALIGAGANATFNDSVSAQQSITAGTLNVNISSSMAGASTTNSGHTLTLPATKPQGSTFTTGPEPVTVTNNSDIATQMVTLVVTATTNNDALAKGLRVRIDAVNGSRSTPPVFDGPLADLQAAAAGIPALHHSLAVGGSMSAMVTFYANNLDNDAQGGTVTPTFTIGFTG